MVECSGNLYEYDFLNEYKSRFLLLLDFLFNFLGVCYEYKNYSKNLS